MATVCGLPAASSARVRVPVRVPRALGVKVTAIAQDALAAKLDPHVVVRE
jgi:hypothetical protein